MRRFLYHSLITLCCYVVLLLIAQPTMALDEFEYRDDRSPWAFRARMGLVSPNYEESYVPADTDDGNKDVLTSALLLDSDVSYQFSPRFSFAASLGYAAQEKEDFSITASSTVRDNSKMTLIPTTYMLRFHPAPYGKINPYIGVGWAYIFGFSSFAGAEAGNGSGIAFQAGVDYWLDNQFFVNFDVKQIAAELEIDYTNSFSGNAVKGSYTYDPLFISAGMGLRF